MGRRQINGNEFCPVPTCDSLSLVRLYTKKVRNRSTGRYVKRYYCQHNDRNIPEHYVDNYVRKKQNELLLQSPLGEIIKSLNLLANDVDISAFLTQKITQQIKNFPMTDNEASEASNSVKQKTELVSAIGKIMQVLNLGMMLRIQGKQIPDWLRIEEERLTQLAEHFDDLLARTDKLINENPSKAMDEAANIVRSDPLYSVYEKYEFPKRRKRYKDAGDRNPRWN